MKNQQKEWIKDPHMAEVNLSYKSNPENRNNPIISCPDDAYEYIKQIWDDDKLELQESFIVLLLNNAKRVIGWSKISTGGATSTIVSPSNVMQVAVLANAQSIILAHNHPSAEPGEIKPSRSDIRLTRSIKSVLLHAHITVEDHLILVRGGYYSFKEHGQL
jgi:DNA repair protein RadC